MLNALRAGHRSGRLYLGLSAASAVGAAGFAFAAFQEREQYGQLQKEFDVMIAKERAEATRQEAAKTEKKRNVRKKILRLEQLIAQSIFLLYSSCISMPLALPRLLVYAGTTTVEGGPHKRRCSPAGPCDVTQRSNWHTGRGSRGAAGSRGAIFDTARRADGCGGSVPHRLGERASG